jgi:endonuclease/exonuclease/phosphatase family metal-dependent hydrolase
LGGSFLLTVGFAFWSGRIHQNSVEKSALTVMTYNIQQANDVYGEKSYLEQLEMIRQVDPDILALQESDSARISLNNNDYVRYFARKLGYYSYYGPKTVAGTYGTAILSKYPLENPRTVFSFSDQDEVGTGEAEIEVSGRRFTIYDVHPDGSDTAILAFAETLLAHAAGQANVIALGDYNLRDYEEAYQLIDAVYTNAWMNVYPDGISDDGVDMSGENRIDHIFVSPHLLVRNPVYVLPPESATDHPVHWTEVTWEE